MRDVVRRAERFGEDPREPTDMVLRQGPDTALLETQREKEWIEVDSESLVDLEVVR